MPLYKQEADANNQDQMNQRRMLKAATHVLLSLLKIGNDQPPAPPADVVHSPNAGVNTVNQLIPTIRLQDLIFAMTF